MGQLLDLAVVGLALLVSGTLALLAWTFGISAVGAVRRAQHRILVTRLQLTIIERQLMRRYPRRDKGDE